MKVGKSYWMPNGVRMVELFAKLGEEIGSRAGTLRFIRSTGKGFNFLIVDRNRVLFKRAFYSRRYANKELPDEVQEVRITMPLHALNWIGL